MADYRDPQVTETKDGGGMGKMIAMLVGALLILALLAWALGWFGGTDVAETEVIDADPAAVVVTEEVADPALATPELVDTAEIAEDPNLVVDETVATEDTIVLENDTTVVSTD